MKVPIKSKRTYTLDEMDRIMYPDPLERKKFQEEVAIEVKKLEAEYQAEVSEKLRRARERAKLSQKELAEKLNTKKTAISRLESGRQNVTLRTLVRALEAIGRPYKITIEVR